jgi:hypothetical protein
MDTAADWRDGGIMMAFAATFGKVFSQNGAIAARRKAVHTDETVTIFG